MFIWIFSIDFMFLTFHIWISISIVFFFLSFWNKMNKWMFDQISNTCISFCIYIWLNKKIKKKKNDFFPSISYNQWWEISSNAFRIEFKSMKHISWWCTSYIYIWFFSKKKKKLILSDFVVIIEWEKDKLKGRMNEMRKKNMECKCHL